MGYEICQRLTGKCTCVQSEGERDLRVDLGGLRHCDRLFVYVVCVRELVLCLRDE